MASARWSLPLPDSPRRSRLTSWSTTFSTVSRSARMAAFFVRTKSLRRGSRRLTRIARRRAFPTPGEAKGRLGCEVGRHVRRVTPEPLQPVKPAGFLREDVHDEVAVVEEHPAPGRGSFDEQGLDPVLLP